MPIIIKEVAHKIIYHPKERAALFRGLSEAEQSAVFEKLSPHVKQSILGQLKDGEIIALIDEMDLHRAEHALVQITNEKRRKRIVSCLKGDLRDKVAYFLRFHPRATTSLINFNYLLLSADTTISEAAEVIEVHCREVGKPPEVLVHEGGELIGEVPLVSLIKETNTRVLKKYVVPVKTMPYQARIESVVSSFEDKPRGKLVVLDKDQSVIGIIYSRDALELLKNESSNALYDFAGVSDLERVFDSVGKKVKNRYKWLIVNLATTFLAATTIFLFKDVLSQLVILAIYMPVVSGMGGNAATQTLAVIVRGVTVGEVDLKRSLPVIYKEIEAGFVNGVINGLIVALVATFWNGSPLLGFVLALAMIINMIVAGFFGSIVPLIMKAIGKDPATSAIVFITTATDVLGFLVFLGLAKLILL